MTGGATKGTRQPKGRTISLDYLEALAVKKAIEAYITTLESLEDNAALLVSKEDAINTLEGVVEKIEVLPYFGRTVVATKTKSKNGTTATAT